jgi:hypothetical protein
MRVIAGAVLAGGLLGCGGGTPEAGAGACAPDVSLSFLADPGSPGAEAYLCFGFDPNILGGAPLRSIHVEEPPPGGPTILHHVSLYALPGDFPDGPVPCVDMPAATSVFVATSGGDPLTLPEDVGLVLPGGTRRLVVQAHVLRLAPGEAAAAALRLCGASGAPAHLAAWMPMSAPVPAIRPYQEETSTATCTVQGDLRAVIGWAHMHRIGAAFHGAVLPAEGPQRSLIDVDPWDFAAQHLYPLDATIAAGDRIETACVWQNPSASYVLPGPGVENEMCNQALVVWPSERAACTP